ncbi:AraC family transcriptional regulator [Thalassomonas viridans]|uniref:AraC family transcriptional regulator n=1 Tax=Thalassomonas viridans TaxID=137584 RepID=A0AAE9Z2U8_9GAMM|nr:AraC family transcriptional regulator [Thalassomonas viridans]WDE05756.1 AraC family transcriptional regulator [Thalassomonas viridans]
MPRINDKQPPAKKTGLFYQESRVLPYVTLRRADRSSACYHTHSHDEFSFGVIDNGVADYHNMRHKGRLSAGASVSMNPGDAHSCNPSKGNWCYRMLFVDSAWVARLQQDTLVTRGQDYLPFDNMYRTDPAGYRQFDQLFRDLQQENNPLALESRLIEYLLPRFARGTISAQAQVRDLYRLNRVKELIMDRLDANLSLDDFVACAGLSRYHLIRSFKQVYGQSPHAFQLDQRIGKAKRLLAGGAGITETAAALGFADQSHFHRHFQKRIALTPKQYQNCFQPG